MKRKMLNLFANIVEQLKGEKLQTELSDTPKKFVILTVARTGSNYLCSALNNHPEILCHNELFHKKKIFSSNKEHSDIKLGSIQKRNYFPGYFIKKVWQQNLGCLAVGFKLFPEHNEKALNLLLKDKKVKKILLFRRNKVKSYISLQIALEKKEWTLRNPEITTQEQTNQTISIKVKPKRLQKYVEETNKYYENLRQQLKASNQEFLEIAYEDMFGAEGEALKAELLEFIGVSVNTEHLNSDLKKQNPQPLSQLVKNFAKLETALRGTELESCLYS